MAQPTVDHLFGKGNKALEMLPPTRDALELHAAQANHQAKIWLQADKEHIDVASPTETCVWKKESGGIQAVWSLTAPYSRCLSGACDLWVQIKVQDSRMQLLLKELEVHFRVWPAVKGYTAAIQLDNRVILHAFETIICHFQYY